MQNVFDKAQSSVSYALLCKELGKILDGKNRKEFLKEFIRLLRFALVRPEDDRFANSMVNFAVEFIVGLDGNLSTTLQNQNLNENNDFETSDKSESMTPNVLQRNSNIMKHVIEFLLKCSSATCPLVRARSCEMIGKILKEMSDEAEIDYELSLTIEKKMLSSTRDKISSVRAAAFLAITRLQDPANEDCLVTQAYLAHLELDPCPEVRRTILDVLEPSRRSLPNVAERCRDVNESVRKAAYAFLGSNVHLQVLSTEQRMEILHQGLNDRSPKVKSYCSKTFLDKWLAKCDGNPLTFIKYLCLDEPLHVATQVLNVFFKGNKPDDIVKHVDFIDEEHKVQVDKLTEENVFYWKTLCIHLKSVSSVDGELLDAILPDIPILCGVIKQLAQQRDPSTDMEKCYENDFICEQLIELIGVHEFVDDCCKKLVERFICDMLSASSNTSLVPCLMRHLPNAVTDTNRGIDMMLELISNLIEPLIPVEVNLSEKEKHDLDMKMGGLRVKIMGARDQIEKCIAEEDFEKAGRIKLELAQLEKEKDDLKELYKPTVQDIRTQKNDPETKEMCLTIICELYVNYKLKVLTPGLRMLLDSLILSGIQCMNRSVKKAAILALGHTCLLDKDLASKFFVLMFQIIRLDHPEVRMAALKVVYDLLMVHDSENFAHVEANMNMDNGEANDTMPTLNAAPIEGGISSGVINILCSYLNCEEQEVAFIAAEGLAKLLLCRKIFSHQVLAQLMILWYSPRTENNLQLRAMLGAFFPCYAASRRDNQVCIMAALVPTLRKICNAPHNSPDRGISLENVCKFFVQLTAIRTLQNVNSNAKECSVHVEMATEISHEILQHPETEISWWLVKVLPTLELTGATEDHILILGSFIEKLEEDIGESTLLTALEKFKTNVRNKSGKEPADRTRRKRRSGDMSSNSVNQ